MLEVGDLIVSYGTHVVLDGVNLALGSGEFVTLTGPSGSGKSTLLRAIIGIVEPTGGKVLLDGFDLTGVPIHRRGIGMMFQDLALFPHLTVAQNIEYGLRRSGMKRADRRAKTDEYLGLVRLGDYANRYIGEISGGQRQRVALARAMATEPKVLLLDEPFGSLDIELKHELIPEVAHLLRSAGIAVLAVTHDPLEPTLLGSDRTSTVASLSQRGAFPESA